MEILKNTGMLVSPAIRCTTGFLQRWATPDRRKGRHCSQQVRNPVTLTAAANRIHNTHENIVPYSGSDKYGREVRVIGGKVKKSAGETAGTLCDRGGSQAGIHTVRLVRWKK